MDDKVLQALRFAHESEAMRQERTIKRLWIIILILICMLFGSNIAWVIYELNFEEVETVQIQQETEWENDSDVIMNGTGEVTVNGWEGKANDNDNQDPVEGEED